MQATLAVIADPHFSDLRGNYIVDSDVRSKLPGGLQVRAAKDFLQSSRLFNESEPALRAVLDDIVARGIRLVLIVGDYSDDGQRESVEGVMAIFRDYSRRYGIRFLSTVGNHDVYGFTGRRFAKNYILESGDAITVSGTIPDQPEAIFSPEMACRSYEAGLPRALGFVREKQFLLWETPFGKSDRLEDRQYVVCSAGGAAQRFTDASYLVEPQQGLWLLSIDANVFVPRDLPPTNRPEDAFDDSTDAGYNAVVQHRQYLVEWIADVVRRADQMDKRLVAFSHYPICDPFDATLNEELELFGNNVFARRTPRVHAADVIAQTGIGLHFSGHLHIDNVSRHAGLTNIAVPSTAGYPGGYKILSIDDDGAELETVRIGRFPLNPTVMSAYRAEAEKNGFDFTDLLESRDFDEFIRAHIREVNRYRIQNEWPAELRAQIEKSTMLDFLESGSLKPDMGQMHFAALGLAGRLPAFELCLDMYAARHNCAFRHEMHPGALRDLYTFIAAQDAGKLGASATLLRMIRKHFDKEDTRKIQFSRDWKQVMREDSRISA
ncbi:metallophosphoesterase [Shinella zoogloeoides]|uniref:metallophosphoesterase family protein n=1 Tax=Shinella zoogloeoides TaxID=352475 RepID=UPI0028B1F8E4|nr:metallophosphoesterase [Shinella zoogloeoides]